MFSPPFVRGGCFALSTFFATASAAGATIATLRCAPGCRADLEGIEITKNGTTVFPSSPIPPFTMGCSNPGSPVATADLGSLPPGVNDFHVRIFLLECADTDVETDTCDVVVPPNQVPWAVQFNVNNQGASCNVYGQNPPSPVRTGARAPAIAGLGSADAALMLNDAPCSSSTTRLCIDDAPGDRRFALEVSYATTQSGGLSGDGKAIPLSSLGVNRGGLFWFFAADNPEMMVKVLANSCGAFDDIWFFATAGTNVGFEMTLSDTLLERSKTYTNADLTAAKPIQDTAALPCD